MATKKNISKQDIINETIKLINENEVDNVSLGDIAKAIGISKGTLFYYYSSKDLIFVDIIKQYLNDLAADFLSWIDNANKDTSITRLTNYVVQYGARNEVPRGKLHLYLINKALSNEQHFMTLFRENYVIWRDLLSMKINDRIHDDKISEDYATLLLVLIDGIIVQDLAGLQGVEIASLLQFIKL